MFNQTIKDKEKLNGDVGGCDMSYDEVKQWCRNIWEDEHNYPCIDRSKKKDQGRFCSCTENWNTYIECIPRLRIPI